MENMLLNANCIKSVLFPENISVEHKNVINKQLKFLKFGNVVFNQFVSVSKFRVFFHSTLWYKLIPNPKTENPPTIKSGMKEGGFSISVRKANVKEVFAAGRKLKSGSVGNLK